MDTCQTCKLHSNRPSFCKFGEFVGRKSPACADHKADPIKVARLSKANREAQNV